MVYAIGKHGTFTFLLFSYFSWYFFLLILLFFLHLYSCIFLFYFSPLLCFYMSLCLDFFSSHYSLRFSNKILALHKNSGKLYFVRSNYRQRSQLYILQNNLKPCSEKNLISERYIRTK